MTRARTQFRGSDFGPATALQRPLNDFALDIQTRLAAIENAGLNRKILGCVFTTGATVSPTVSPFPIRIPVPENFTPIGVTLLAIQNVSAASSYVESAAITVRHRIVGSTIEVRYVTGLDANTSYSLTLEATGR